MVTVAAVTTEAPSSAVSPTKKVDLSNAPLPAGLCEHPAGNLVNGNRDFGFDGNDDLVDTAYGRIRGGATALGVISCNAGGVGWPQAIVFYRASASGKPQLVAWYDLFGLRRAEHVELRNLKIKNGQVWIDTESYEGAGSSIQRITARLYVKGSDVLVTLVVKGPMTNVM